MIDINLLERLLREQLIEAPCEDHSCEDCQEIRQLTNSVLMSGLVRNVVSQIKPSSLSEDIYQTFYLGLKIGRLLERNRNATIDNRPNPS